MFTSELGFEITTRCPLTCAHCIVDSGPKRNESIVPFLAQWLGDGAALVGISHVVATGGEPFLYPKALRKLSHTARDRGCRFRVITSASWARTENVANRMLDRVPVDHLVVSFDEYHRKFMSIAGVLNALRAALLRNIQVTLNVVAPEQNVKHEVEMLRSEIVAILGTVSADAIQITGQPLLRAGRGLSFDDSAAYHWSEFDSCPMAAQHVVKANGDVIACCGPPAYRLDQPANWLQLGNLYRQSLGKILNSVKRNALVRAIHLFGPKVLFELGGAPAKQCNQHFDSRCSACVAALSNEDLMHEVLVALKEPTFQRRLALACALSGDLTLLEFERDTTEDAAWQPLAFFR